MDGFVGAGLRDGDLEPAGFQLTAGERRILVVGPPGSGRTTALDTLASGLAAAGYPVALLGARWGDASREPSLWSPDGGVAVSGHGRTDREQLIEFRRAHPDLAVLVDDAERFAGLPIEPALLEIARRVDEDRGVIVAATSGVALEGRVGALSTDLTHARTGVVLWPAPGMPALGVSGSARLATTPRIPGRGILVSPRGVERIQVATAPPDGRTGPAR
jgi:S-DNA-T family DNA segregation ATPase FtsK/SpoIIIE